MNGILLKEWIRFSANDLITARHLFYDCHQSDNNKKGTPRMGGVPSIISGMEVL